MPFTNLDVVPVACLAGAAALRVVADAMTAHVSGWLMLSKRYRARGAMAGQLFPSTMAWVARSSAGALTPPRKSLRITINGSGIGLAERGAARLFSPDLFIPWENVESVRLPPTSRRRVATIDIRGSETRLAINGPAAYKALAEFERASRLG